MPADQQGGVTGVVAPSGQVSAPERLDRGLTALRQLGFDPVLGPVANSAHAGGLEPAPRDRAEEINGFVRDSSVRGIIAAIGGYTANTILPHLDYAAWRARSMREHVLEFTARLWKRLM